MTGPRNRPARKGDGQKLVKFLATSSPRGIEAAYADAPNPEEKHDLSFSDE